MDEIVLTITRLQGPDGEVVLALAGELDLSGEEALREALADALGSNGDGNGSRPGLLIDLGDLTFLGSTGIRFLLEARSRADSMGRPFAVVGANGSVLRTLYMVKVLEQLGMRDDGAAGGEGDGSRQRQAEANPGG